MSAESDTGAGGSLFFWLRWSSLVCESAKYGDSSWEHPSLYPFGNGSQKTAPGAGVESLPKGPLLFLEHLQEFVKFYLANFMICQLPKLYAK